MKAYLQPRLREAVQALGVAGDVDILLELPRNPEHGDLSTNLAMALARELKMAPRSVAEKLIAQLRVDPELVPKIDIAGPGFINFAFSPKFFHERLAALAAEKPERLGASTTGQGKRVNVEYVSANPTGLLHLGHGRNSAVGDTVANILEWNGYEVEREYYFNNAGNQMKKLTDSTYARYHQLLGEEDYPFPEDGYHGDYIKEIASEIERSYGNALLDHSEESEARVRACAEEWCFSRIVDTMKRLGIKHTMFVNEQHLHRDGFVTAALERLRDAGYIYEKDDATWFAAEKLGLDKDRVLIKSSGEPTYRLPDIAYHIDKLERGFDWIIDVLGSDHAATVPDVIKACEVLGYDVSKITPLIHQFVTLTDGGKQVKMSKRNAKVHTIDDLIEEAGADIVRYFFLMRNNSTQFEFDLALARDQTEKNPVLYLQYAHARVASLQGKAAEQGLTIGADIDWSQLTHDREMTLIKELLRFRETIIKGSETLEPVVICDYLRDVASAFHKFYHDCQIISAEPRELAEARLALARLTQIVMKNGLTILGISAPESM